MKPYQTTSDTIDACSNGNNVAQTINWRTTYSSFPATITRLMEADKVAGPPRARPFRLAGLLLINLEPVSVGLAVSR